MSKVSFTLLLQKIQPLLDKDRAVQLDSLLIRFKNNEISTDDLLQRTRSIVGDHLFKPAMYMLQIQAVRDSLTASSQLLSLPQASVQQMSPSATQIAADLSKSDEVENQAGLLPVQDLIDQTNEKHNKAEISSAQRLFPSSSAQIKQGNAAPGNLKDEYSSMQSSRMGVMPLPRPTATSISSKSSTPSLTSSIGPGNSSKAPKLRFVGKKKPTEARNFSSPPSSKKQKLSGAFLHQSIRQLNDVSILSGIDIREEEEHLFAGLKKDSLVSEASRRVVQEEEEHMFFHKIPLQKKLMETIARHGLKRTSNDVEHCLSLCVEERMRDLVSNLIRLSKKRIDVKKTSHRTVITSDVKQQVMEINHKAHEERERKQAKTEKSKPESTTGADGDKKNESCARSAKEQVAEKGTKAANVAIRAATGVADMMSKWQLMVEAKQKQGGIDKSYDSHQLCKNDNNATNPSNRDGSEAFDTPALVGKVGQHQVVVPQVTRRITVKDVIAVLERDPQLSKSTLIYTLYNKVFTGGGE